MPENVSLLLRREGQSSDQRKPFAGDLPVRGFDLVMVREVVRGERAGVTSPLLWLQSLLSQTQRRLLRRPHRYHPPPPRSCCVYRYHAHRATLSPPRRRSGRGQRLRRLAAPEQRQGEVREGAGQGGVPRPVRGVALRLVAGCRRGELLTRKATSFLPSFLLSFLPPGLC